MTALETAEKALARLIDLDDVGMRLREDNTTIIALAAAAVAQAQALAAIAEAMGDDGFFYVKTHPAVPE